MGIFGLVDCLLENEGPFAFGEWILGCHVMSMDRSTKNLFQMMEIVTCEYPYPKRKNPGRIYKKVISGIKPTLLDKAVKVCQSLTRAINWIGRREGNRSFSSTTKAAPNLEERASFFVESARASEPRYEKGDSNKACPEDSFPLSKIHSLVDSTFNCKRRVLFHFYCSESKKEGRN
ncbi:unnamed protein product [Dovyalis caffra]|uniref:Uncharacterized protein n=1 Tax=Dovyalis caffra TaxID=77055 RepID=A0AAV1RD22_9ROSI|nr:unnamed protein product [Dovyalis caffra]